MKRKLQHQSECSDDSETTEVESNPDLSLGLPVLPEARPSGVCKTGIVKLVSFVAFILDSF